MILVDTSVWIRFLAGREPFARTLDVLLEEEIVLGHVFVFGELLIGSRGGRRTLLAAYEMLPQASVVAHDDVVTLVRARKLDGRGVGWVDAHLLAATLVDTARLWTADARLDALACELGVAHVAT